MEVHEETYSTVVVGCNSLNSKNRWLFMRLSCAIKPIQVVAECVHAIVAMIDSIWVDQGNDKKDKMLK